MSLIQETFRRKPIFIDLKNSSLSKNEKDLFDDDNYYNKHIKKLNNKQKESSRNNDKHLIREDVAHADYIERLILGKITFLFAHTLNTRSFLID